jgi:hypothetical protein
MTEEDEAFNEIERQAKQRKESVKAAVQTLSEYERGFIDGMQKQMQSSVDKAVNAMSQPTYYIPSKDRRTWAGLTDEDISEIVRGTHNTGSFVRAIEAKLKEKNT